MQTIQQTMAGLRPIEMNADSEYARSFGIEKGDIVFLDRFINAVHGDLFLVQINGKHQLDTYDEAYTILDENSIGVLCGCLKTFKGLQADDDTILDATVIDEPQ